MRTRAQVQVFECVGVGVGVGVGRKMFVSWQEQKKRHESGVSVVYWSSWSSWPTSYAVVRVVRINAYLDGIGGVAPAPTPLLHSHSSTG